MTAQEKPLLVKLKITGQPVVLKNNKMIAFNRKTGGRFIKSNARVDAYERVALLQLRSQWKNKSPITVPVGIKLTFYGAWHRVSENIPDISNLYEAPQDLLQKAGVLLNDRQIEHHDGSRRVCLCDLDCPRKKLKQNTCGHMKQCEYARVEIELFPA
jgi:Holliday junction resolvase RusA-like endonuclease